MKVVNFFDNIIVIVYDRLGIDRPIYELFLGACIYKDIVPTS